MFGAAYFSQIVFGGSASENSAIHYLRLSLAIQAQARERLILDQFDHLHIS